MTSPPEPEFVRPVDVQAARIAELESLLQLSEERVFFLSAEVARLNSEINQLARYLGTQTDKPSAGL